MFSSGLALPGLAWLVIWILVPGYAVLAVAMGTTNFLQQPIPAWDPTAWSTGLLGHAFSSSLPGGEYWPAVRNTLVYVSAALCGCFVIGYPVAYYVARHARRWRGVLLAVLVAPLCINYLLRMLAWIGLLSAGGYVDKALSAVGISPPGWLNGNPYSVIIALIYGYLPYFILPLYSGLDRIDQSHIEAAHDLGATRSRAFLFVTLPLSRGAILAGTVLAGLPMFGDYFTNDLISGSPRTDMLGNVINLFVQGGPEQNLGASLVIVLMTILAIFMAYYVYTTVRGTGTSL